MPEDDVVTRLQKQIQTISDDLDSLAYTVAKKTGSGSNEIQGSVVQSVNYKSGSTGWALTPDGNLEANNGNFRGDITGASGTFSGTVTATALNIPDATTANSMHVDSSGNTWWGANVATGYTGAPAYILNTGAIKFQNIQIGGTTYQYTISNTGIYTFGDQADSLATFDGSATPSGSSKSGSDYTLTRDVYYTDMTMSTGTTLNPTGFRIFVSGTLTLNGTAIIKRNGNAGGVGGLAVGSTTGGGPGIPGAALADGYLKGSLIGGAGGQGFAGDAGDNGNGQSVSGGNTSNSLGSNGAAGGGGGNGGDGTGAGGTGGIGGTSTGGTATVPNVALRAGWHLTTLLDVGSTGATVKYDNSAASAGGGGGAGGNRNAGGLASGSGGGGGGAGSGGGIIAIFARSIVIGASAAIQSTGGNGGNGGNGSASPNVDAGGGGGGGGAAGGNGGIIILVYNTLSNSGALTVTGGTKGTKGIKGAANGAGAAGIDGVDGSNGTAGTTYQFVVSL